VTAHPKSEDGAAPCRFEKNLRYVLSFRHTFVSLLLQNQEPLTYVKDQLGHASIKMTVDACGHLVPRSNRQAVNRLPTLDKVVLSSKAAKDKPWQ
jgi:integrase